MERLPLFEAGDGFYAIYRIPGIVVTASGMLLVCCEARRSPHGDWGASDLLLRRSTDGGRTWEPPRRMNRSPEPVMKNLAANGQGLDSVGQTCNNPLLIADRQPGRVHFLYQIAP